MFEAEKHKIQQDLSLFLQQKGIPDPDIQWKWIPFNGQWGIATSFFASAASLAKSGDSRKVGDIAKELAGQAAETLGIPIGFEKVEPVNGYLNFIFSTSAFAQTVLKEVTDKGESFGRAADKNELVMVEFSQPNTHKAMHVGHLRSAILGDVIARILEFNGFDVVRANYPGDIGLHVIKWLWCYQKYHDGEVPTSNITRWMGEIYVDAGERLAAEPELEAEVRDTYVKWDRKDPEIVALWQKTRDWSLRGFAEIYNRLGIEFDKYYFQSEQETQGKEIVEQLIRQGIAIDERPEGAVIVKLDDLLGLKQEKYRVFVILRSDGTALYATEDLGLATRKFTEYPDLSKAYYVVDVRQSLHFQQVFKTLEVAGNEFAKKLTHIPYEIVTLPGNVVMASRDGTVVYLEALMDEAVERALQVVREKNPDLTEEQKLEVAEAVGIGAIKYPMLARESTKIVTFDWEAGLDFNGQAAPYIQYAYVRGGSILRKAVDANLGETPMTHDPDVSEITLIDQLARFPGEVERAGKELRPLTIAAYSYDLAKAFNDFYNRCPVLQEADDIRRFRLHLVKATRQVLANSLALLGITAPQAM